MGNGDRDNNNKLSAKGLIQCCFGSYSQDFQ